jgi:hypothetical protein
LSLNNTIQISRSTVAIPSIADELLSRSASRYFIQRFFGLVFAILAVSSVLLFMFAEPSFRSACFYGISFPIITSFISFLVTEWAFDQPNAIFLTVAFGSMVLRMFSLLIVFMLGLFILHMSVFGLISGLLGSYFAFLVIEIAYVHNKGRLLGQ